jgi:hypothetical protein
MDIPYSFIIEMRDKGTHGFLIPDEQIRVAGDELWAAVDALVPLIT